MCTIHNTFLIPLLYIPFFFLHIHRSNRSPFQPYSAPPSTNKTAGYTPHPIKRKLDFALATGLDSPSPIKKQPKIVISKFTQAKTTYLYHEALPDGFIMSFCAKGKPDGENGFMSSAYKTMELDLQDEQDNNSFASKMMVSSVLPTRDPITLDARMYSFRDKSTGNNIQLQKQSFVYNKRYLDEDMSPES